MFSLPGFTDPMTGAWWVYHGAIVLIRLATVVLLMLALVRVGLHQGAAIAGALLFGLHPVSSEAILWLAAAYGYITSALLLLAAVLFYLKYERRRSCSVGWGGGSSGGADRHRDRTVHCSLGGTGPGTSDPVAFRPAGRPPLGAAGDPGDLPGGVSDGTLCGGQRDLQPYRRCCRGGELRHSRRLALRLVAEFSALRARPMACASTLVFKCCSSIGVWVLRLRWLRLRRPGASGALPPGAGGDPMAQTAAADRLWLAVAGAALVVGPVVPFLFTGRYGMRPRNLYLPLMGLAVLGAVALS